MLKMLTSGKTKKEGDKNPLYYLCCFSVMPKSFQNKVYFQKKKRNYKETEAEKVDQLIFGHKVLEGCGRRPWLVQVSVC